MSVDRRYSEEQLFYQSTFTAPPVVKPTLKQKFSETFLKSFRPRKPPQLDLRERQPSPEADILDQSLIEIDRYSARSDEQLQDHNSNQSPIKMNSPTPIYSRNQPYADNSFPSAPRPDSCSHRQSPHDSERVVVPGMQLSNQIHFSQAPELPSVPPRGMSPAYQVVMSANRKISQPERFDPLKHNAHTWIKNFEMWVSFNQLQHDHEAIVSSFVLLQTDAGSSWYHSSKVFAFSHLVRGESGLFGTL